MSSKWSFEYSAYQLVAIKNLPEDLLSLEEHRGVVHMVRRVKAPIVHPQRFFSNADESSEAPTSIKNSESGIKKRSQINNRIFAPESGCNTNEISSVFAVHGKNLHMSPDIKPPPNSRSR